MFSKKTIFIIFFSTFASFGVQADGILSCSKTIVVSEPGNYTITPNCTSEKMYIFSSNVSIDCNQANFNSVNSSGIMINGKGNRIENVKVENCNINNSKGHGVWITSGIKMFQYSDDIKNNFDVSPFNILIKNFNIDRSGQSGVYVDSYSQDVSIIDSNITHSSGVGLYLEQSSKNNIIKGNNISWNGWGNGNNLREGIAVDSSAGNLIENNKFSNNGLGGVFLYKNCGEHIRAGNSVIRWQHSDKNTIKNNNFDDEKNGVWLASRQSQDMSKWGCGDKPLDAQGRYFQDYANNNLVENNKFSNVKVPIKDEGKNNLSVNNISN